MTNIETDYFSVYEYDGFYYGDSDTTYYSSFYLSVYYDIYINADFYVYNAITEIESYTLEVDDYGYV